MLGDNNNSLPGLPVGEFDPTWDVGIWNARPAVEVVKVTKDSAWPDGDWRNIYFTEKNLIPTVDRVEKLRPLVPAGMTMAQFALRWILDHPGVTCAIPGGKRPSQVEENCAASDLPIFG